MRLLRDESNSLFEQAVFHVALQHPKAKTIHLVMDNSNIHRRKSITDLCGPIHCSLHAHSRELAQSG
jgi:hypothetical protein